jgi:Spy/CpxP family protein refolding chaperone
MRLRTILSIFSLFLFAGVAVGQPGPPDLQGPDDRRGDGRPNLLAELNLTPEQVQQIRQFNIERRPQMQAAQRRHREANLALDAAIYADTVNEAEVQARLRELQAAQAELARLRFESELAIRKVLTPEQLTKFREIRRQFEEHRLRMRQNGPPLNRRRLRRVDQQRPPAEF